MTVDSMASGSATLLTGQSMSMMPSTSTQHYMIHNIVIPFGSTCELYYTDGVNTTLVMTLSTSLLSYNLHCSQSHYYTLKNIGASSIHAAFDGAII